MIALFLSFSILPAAARGEVEIERLECEHMTDPLAIETGHPSLGWYLISPHKAKSQKAYRIIVASSASLLKQNKGDYWDTGKINSDNSSQVIYQGKPLSSRDRVYWKVMVWDEKDLPSPWSRVSSWSMGLLQASDWKAKWIGSAHAPRENPSFTYPSPFFRKEFQIAKKVRQAIVHVSGLGFYELSLNGNKIGDQVLAPAVTNYDHRPLQNLLYPYDDQSTQRVFYNSFEVTAQLSAKKNAIGMQLGNGWYNQRDRRVEGDMWYDDPKLIFQLEIQYEDGTNEIIVSDPSWKTANGPLIKDGIFTGEKYDARLEFGPWNKVGFEDSKWKDAVLVSPPTGILRAQHAPFDQIVRTLSPIFEGRSKDSLYTYHLDETVSGWAAICLKGKAGSILKIRYISEEGDDYGQVDTYIVKGSGVESWEPKFTWHAFRRIEVISRDIVLDKSSLIIREVHTEVRSNGTFESSNAFLNKIKSAYIRTQNANFHGSISSDCPHRERLGYTGDGQVLVASSIFSYDMRRFYRKWFDDMGDARNKKTGFVTHTAPFGGGGGGPAWGSAYVIMPWSYFSFYGDSSILAQHYAGMKGWVRYLQTRTNQAGLVDREEPKGWCLGDWCTPNNIEIPEAFVNTAYFYHVTDIMSKAAAVLGKQEEQIKFRQLADKIRVDFNKAYYDRSKGSYWQGRQGADVFALAFGLVPAEDRTLVFNSLLAQLKRLNYHFDTGILGTPLLLKVLSEQGRDDLAYQIMDQKGFPGFGYLLDPKNSTLWETWDGQGSKSHPMFGSVVEWFYYAIGGIKPDQKYPGMQHFWIEPKPVAELSFCKSSYDSPYGKIRSEWKKESNGKMYILIEIPVNSSATFVLPAGKTSIIDESGQAVPVQKLKRKFQATFPSGVYKLELN